MGGFLLREGNTVTHIRKAALVCNKCGERLDIDPNIEQPFVSSFMQRKSTWIDWLEVANNHHLCPACAKVYNACKAEMEAELKRLAGIKTIAFEI